MFSQCSPGFPADSQNSSKSPKTCKVVGSLAVLRLRLLPIGVNCQELK